MFPSRVDFPDQPFTVSLGQGLDLQDAVISGEQERGLTDVLLDSGCTENFHGAQVVAAPSRMVRGLRVLFHEEVTNAEAGEKQGGGQPHKGATSDQDGHAFVGL